MLNLNPFALSGLLTFLTSLILIEILLKYKTTRLHKVWLAFNIAVGIWGLGGFFAGIEKDPTAAIGWWKFALLGGYSIPSFFYHTCLEFAGRKNVLGTTLSYIYAGVFITSIFLFLGNPNFAIVPQQFESLYYLRSTSITHNLLLSIWLLYVLLGFIELIKYCRKSVGEVKTRALYFLIAYLIGFSGGCTNTFPMFGLDLYPLGNLTVPIYAIFSVYAIFRHQIMNIRVVLKKSLIYYLIILISTLAYFLFVVILEKTAQHFLEYKTVIINVLATILIAAIFFPIKNRIQYLIDRFFFKGSNIEIAEQNELLRQEVAQTEKLRAVATLASGLAHEIRNPLTTIQTFGENLPRKKDDPEFIHQCRNILVNETQRINDLLTQLLAFAKPSPPALQEINLKNVLVEVLLLTSHQCSKHQIKVQKSLADNQIVKADPNQLKQGFLNIVLNAIDAMPNGGALTVTTSSDHHNHSISIKDTGCGIESKDLKQIFDPFFTKKEKGTGLGLAITHGIIEQHQGKITVTSQQGNGTEFTIDLPIEGKC